MQTILIRQTFTSRRRVTFAVFVGLWLLSCDVEAQEPDLPNGVVIQIDPLGKLDIHLLRHADELKEYPGPGFVVWDDGSNEICAELPWEVASPITSTTSVLQSLATRFVSRGSGSNSPSTAGILTTQLDQLLGRANIRGKSFLTPQGRHLFPQITIRRLPTRGRFPAATLSIMRNNETVISFSMQDGQQQLAWPQIPDLSPELTKGLPPGEYTLRVDGESTSSRFTVEDDRQQTRVMRWSRNLENLLGTTDSPIYIQFTVAQLLNGDTSAQNEPYAADALEILEELTPDQWTSHLLRQKEELLQRMGSEGPKSTSSTVASNPTGIETIDHAREQIQRGDWRAAIETLDHFVPASPRESGFVDLYRAVALAESGPVTEPIVHPLFHHSMAILGSDSADAYRAHSNYASFLLDRVQDRLNNYAVQTASGVRSPLLRALVEWKGARHHYDEALRRAELQNFEGDRAAVLVNLARLYAILADLIRSLDDPQNLRFAELEESAAQNARRSAELVTQRALPRERNTSSNLAAAEPSSTIDDLTLAVAHEVLAQLAFRRLDGVACSIHANQAEQHYLAIGSLAGVESLERLRGLTALRGLMSKNREDSNAGEAKEALRHFEISHLLSESLRQNISKDAAGMTRAGFFSRRAYVYEQIIGLLLDQQAPRQALHYVELSKARSLQDVLMVQAPQVDSLTSQTDLGDLLETWPKEHVLVEYFIGSERSWCFVMDSDHDLQAFVLKDGTGQPIHSRDLVRRVRLLLNGFDHQSVKMTNRLIGGHGFDHAWQDELDALRRILLPTPLLERLRRNQQVIIVPHHILHYLPFAALVTQLDYSTQDQKRMVKPRFVIDEPFTLTHSPSLTFWHTARQRANRPLTNVYTVGLEEFDSAPTLPGVQTEIDHVKELFGERVRQDASGMNATEGRTKQLLARQGMLFLATHGINIADRSLDSHLLLRADSDNDGYFTAREIYESDGGVDLVVLSACYSGLADRSPLPGDDLFGLQRSLLHSGSRAVVSGLWDVYDQTAPMITQQMMAQLSIGIPVSEALAGSQRQFLDRLRASPHVEPWIHPYFWAMFTVVGDGRVHFLKPTQTGGSPSPTNSLPKSARK
jgi:CHAT domain